MAPLIFVYPFEGVERVGRRNEQKSSKAGKAPGTLRKPADWDADTGQRLGETVIVATRAHSQSQSRRSASSRAGFLEISGVGAGVLEQDEREGDKEQDKD